MTLHQLVIFDTVVKHLNITKAAREINISQPTVSKQFKLLEKEFGVKFHRNIAGQGIELTEEGRLFWNAVQPLLQQVENLKRLFANGEKLQESKFLTIGCSESPAVCLLPKILKAFRQSYPNVHPIIRAGTSRAVEQMLLDSLIEIALISDPHEITSGSNTRESSQITLEPLLSRNAVAVVSSKHPLAKKRKLNEDEIATAPVIARVDSSIVRQLQRLGVKLNIVIECESSHAVLSAVESGSGIGVLHRDFVESALKRGSLKTIAIPRLGEIGVLLFAAYYERALRFQNVYSFLKLLRQRSTSKNEPGKLGMVAA